MQSMLGLVIGIISYHNLAMAYQPFPTGIQFNHFYYIGQSSASMNDLLTLGGYRFYNPCEGEFLKQDTYSAFKNRLTFNGFNYALGNPVLFIDRNGHVSMVKKITNMLAQCLGKNTSPCQPQSPNSPASTPQSPAASRYSIDSSRPIDASMLPNAITTSRSPARRNSTISVFSDEVELANEQENNIENTTSPIGKSWTYGRTLSIGSSASIGEVGSQFDSSKASSVASIPPDPTFADQVELVMQEIGG